MEEEFLGFVITGHVDHGKSTLIGRILYDTNSLQEGRIEEVRKTCEMLGRQMEFAYVIDHLREERENEMTIDTAQTFFRWGNRDYAIIDAPGHKEFMKNMITGASLADAAVLIIDVAEGMREQTQRHAYALGMLGLEQVIVVINKMDKVGHKKENFEKVKAEAAKFLLRLKIKPSHFIPIAALHGENVVKRSENMPWYDGPVLLEALKGFKPRKSLKMRPLRFPVQDVYDFEGKKIAVGRVESGVLAAGEMVALPSGKKIIVKGLEGFPKAPKNAEAGINSGFFEDIGLKRGDVVCAGKLPHYGKKLEGSVFWLGIEPLKKGEKILCRIATQEAEGTVEKISKRMNSSTLEIIENDATKLEGTEAAEVLLSFSKPLVSDLFGEIPTMGRFVLARHGIVEGGGIITKAVE